MKQIYAIFKPLGLTPLEALEKLRKKRKLPQNLKITYAGRLDPMAQGVLLLLAGDKVKEKGKYLKLPKTYRAEVLFGISTDTFDRLGIIAKTSKDVPDAARIRSALTKAAKQKTLQAPVYSSIPVKGLPSFVHARAGRLGQEDGLKRTMNFGRITNFKCRRISAGRVLKRTLSDVQKVRGDFRQEKIIKSWRSSLKKNGNFLLAAFAVSCSSGSYIRSLAHFAGKEARCPALLYNLTRTSVGRYLLQNSEKV